MAGAKVAAKNYQRRSICSIRVKACQRRRHLGRPVCTLRHGGIDAPEKKAIWRANEGLEDVPQDAVRLALRYALTAFERA
jgi:hypothetical protein